MSPPLSINSTKEHTHAAAYMLMNKLKAILILLVSRPRTNQHRYGDVNQMYLAGLGMWVDITITITIHSAVVMKLQ